MKWYSFKYEFAPLFKLKIIKIRLNNYKYPIYIRPNTADYITFIQIFITEEYKFEINKSINPSIIIDCGANIGLTSIYYKNKYQNAQIIAIEPEINNYSLLMENLKYYSDIICLNNGIWNRKCHLNIINENAPENSFVFNESSNCDNIIDAISINDIVNEYKLNEIDILKIDIEGSEKMVFSTGCEEWLPLVKVLIVELHDRFVPGSSKSFFKSVSQYDFETEIKSESICCCFNKIK